MIIEYGGKTVSGIDELHKILTDEAVGQRQTITVLRGTRKSEHEIIPLEKK